MHNGNDQRRMSRNGISTSALMVIFGFFLHASENFGTMALTASSFHGRLVVSPSLPKNLRSNDDSKWYMRKEKASDRRTRRRLQQQSDIISEEQPSTFTRSPMASAVWPHKTITSPARQQRKHHNGKKELGGGRNRSMKRYKYYNTVSDYRNHFLQLLTAEYKHEISYLVDCVVL